MLEVTVKIEGFDEEGNPEPEVTEEIVRKTAEIIAKRLEHDLKAAIDPACRKLVSERLTAHIDEFMARPLQNTNIYGEKKGDPVTFTEYICKAGVEYATELVAENGRKPDYNDRGAPRVLYLARKMAEEQLNKELKPEIEKAKTEAKNFMATKIATALRDAMASAIK